MQKRLLYLERIEEIQRKNNEVEAIRNNLTNQIELVEKKNEETF